MRTDWHVRPPGSTISCVSESVSFRVRPLIVAWLLTVGVGFFFNAGVFGWLFDQSREPGLLGDLDLFQRIPVAYFALAVGVAALSWLFDVMDVLGIWRGARIGALAGFVVACLGIVNLWTALEMTGSFVAAGVVVQVVGFGVAGAFLGAYRDSSERKRLARFALGAALLAATVGVVLQNILKP
jgi:hypothetical protein